MSLDKSSPVFIHLRPLQFPLVNRFYKECGFAVACGRLEQVYCLRSGASEGGEITAAARFLPTCGDHVILRNLCVLPQQRGMGLARSLMQQSLQQLVNSACYCFTEGRLQKFYESLGFLSLSLEQTPQDIAERYRAYIKNNPQWVLMGRVQT